MCPVPSQRITVIRFTLNLIWFKVATITLVVFNINAKGDCYVQDIRKILEKSHLGNVLCNCDVLLFDDCVLGSHFKQPCSYLNYYNRLLH